MLPSQVSSSDRLKSASRASSASERRRGRTSSRTRPRRPPGSREPSGLAVRGDVAGPAGGRTEALLRHRGEQDFGGRRRGSRRGGVSGVNTACLALSADGAETSSTATPAGASITAHPAEPSSASSEPPSAATKMSGPSTGEESGARSLVGGDHDCHHKGSSDPESPSHASSPWAAIRRPARFDGVHVFSRARIPCSPRRSGLILSPGRRPSGVW